MQINRLEKILEELNPFDKSWGAHREALQDCKYRLQDLAYMARDYAAEAISALSVWSRCISGYMRWKS